MYLQIKGEDRGPQPELEEELVHELCCRHVLWIKGNVDGAAQREDCKKMGGAAPGEGETRAEEVEKA